jgi:hypothetical protein
MIAVFSLVFIGVHSVQGLPVPSHSPTVVGFSSKPCLWFQSVGSGWFFFVVLISFASRLLGNSVVW